MIGSALFIPGDRLHLVDKLDRRPADEQPDRVILDLEDSVAQTTKVIERYERDSVQLREAGFGGRLAIHPASCRPSIAPSRRGRTRSEGRNG